MSARSDAIVNVDAAEHVLEERRAAETAAAAAFDQASTHLADMNTRRIVAEQQLRSAQTELTKAFGLPWAFFDEILGPLVDAAASLGVEGEDQ